MIAHGLGGGGHNSYMDVANYFSLNGYYVFAYDATGNDESEGESVMGLPQGLIDLDYAIKYVKQNSKFAKLPIMLFGHSWGGYAVGNILNIHSDIKGVVSIAGFNKSTDLLKQEGKKMVGAGIYILLPHLKLIERLKFGKYASYGAIEGFKNSDTPVMFIHSEDDNMIPIERSFDLYYEQLNLNARYSFVRLKDRGHNYVYYSDEAKRYRDKFNEDFKLYVDSLGEELSAELKADYIKSNLNKKLINDLDEDLMDKMIVFYDSCVEN